MTHDITKYCKAKIFSEVGKRTPLGVRFSTVGMLIIIFSLIFTTSLLIHLFSGGESGSADTARDPRGFAVKFYTEDGNWDLVGNNTPIFFIRDPFLVIQLIN